MSVALRIDCCPLCGNVIRKGHEHPPGIRPLEGLHVEVGHYVNGLAGYDETLLFRADLCAQCCGRVLALLEPGLALIREKDINR